MNLSIKDLKETILAVLAAGLYYAKMNNINLPIITSGYRIPIIILGAIGIVMCTVSGGGNPSTSGSIINTIISAAGVLAFIIIVYGVISGAKIAFTLLTIILLGMWLVSTLRHLIG